MGCDFRVVVCDNASTDGSVEKIEQWARGEIPAEAANLELSSLSSPPVRKPIPYLELSREQAESASAASDIPLILIRNEANLGFAAGNNVGLRYALRDSTCHFFWLLNNDTVVRAEALSSMLEFMRHRPDVGVCGSLNLSYFHPREVQAQGGKSYQRWTGRVRASPRMVVDQLSAASPPMDYVNGASMLATRKFLENIGLLEESYFLYFEELDWAMRAKGKFGLGYCPKSVIYHKEGASIGSNANRLRRSLLAEQYLSRNRVLFTRRYLPFALPSVLLSLALAAGYRLLQGDTERAKAMLVWSMKGLLHRGRNTPFV